MNMFTRLNIRAYNSLYRGTNSFIKLNFKFRNLCTKINEDLLKLRNIGIIAHIDAGKTTTTERMLYYSGRTDIIGEVHDGDTVTDYMKQERERGITITSAAITFKWKKHKINLIDTPGHVDFTFEVERALSVLDGALVILDSSAGVEVQTLKVWEQANRYKLPCVIYLNKMDKNNSDLDMSLLSIRNKLKIEPLLLQVPLGTTKNFRGVVDLIHLQKHVWKNDKNDDGQCFQTENLSPEEIKNLPLILEGRKTLIENIANHDDLIAEKFITDNLNSISSCDLLAALKRITLHKQAVPVLIGSSYKNIGVQLLMDAILNFLPNPSEYHRGLEQHSENLCAFAFKTIHNKSKEPLTFLRIYSGHLKGGQRIYNGTKQQSERIGKVMIPLADSFEEVATLPAGNICVVSNLKATITGDILFDSGSAATKLYPLLEKGSTSKIPMIHIPDPVFFCTIEPPSIGQQNKLDFALQCLQREDPTFQVEHDETIGQTILKGMGELHIDIIKDRILTEYGVDAYLGPLQVAYKETLSKGVENTYVLNKTIGGSKHLVTMTLRIYPCLLGHFQKKVNVIVTKENNLGKIRSDYLKAIESGLKTALNNGPLLSFPVINIGVDLLFLEVAKSTSLAMLTAATSQCINAALKKSTLHLLEPIMNLSIAVSKGYAGVVINDLSQKRSQILSMEARQDVEIILARTPLSELKGYSSMLRALTSGTCSFTIEFESYQKMELQDQNQAIKDVTGFSPF